MTKTGNQIEFEPMLGPAEDYPPGSSEWAERISNRLQLATESITRHTVRHLKDLLVQIWEAEPWKVWPKGAPFETPEDYCRAVTGYSWEQLVLITGDMTNDPDFARRMQADNARAQAEHRVQGAHHGFSSLSNKGEDGGTSRAYLLRRLARDHPNVLEHYQRGEFPSVRAAAKAAGIVKNPTPLERVLKQWPKLTAAERAQVCACEEDHIPNAETLAALEEAERGGGRVFKGSSREIIKTILSEDKAMLSIAELKSFIDVVYGQVLLNEGEENRAPQVKLAKHELVEIDYQRIIQALKAAGFMDLVGVVEP